MDRVCGESGLSFTQTTDSCGSLSWDLEARAGVAAAAGGVERRHAATAPGIEAGDQVTPSLKEQRQALKV
jgi:hypothetical protein